MSLHFLLDAYNIIFSKEFSALSAARKLPSLQQRRSDERSEELSCQVPSLAKGSLEEQHKKLIDFVELKRPQGSLKNSVTIVFDGHPSGNRRAARSAKVLFSCDETADEKILRLVDEAANRKNVIVVTNDRPVQYAVRALGAKVVSVRDFIKSVEPRLIESPSGKKRKRKQADPPKEISQTIEHQINSELRTIWLKKKGNDPQA